MCYFVQSKTLHSVVIKVVPLILPSLKRTLLKNNNARGLNYFFLKEWYDEPHYLTIQFSLGVHEAKTIQLWSGEEQKRK